MNDSFLSLADILGQKTKIMTFSSGFRGQHEHQYEHGQFTSMEQNKGTPRKINIEPENDGLEDDFLFQGARILRFQS